MEHVPAITSVEVDHFQKLVVQVDIRVRRLKRMSNPDKKKDLLDIMESETPVYVINVIQDDYANFELAKIKSGTSHSAAISSHIVGVFARFQQEINNTLLDEDMTSDEKQLRITVLAAFVIKTIQEHTSRIVNPIGKRTLRLKLLAMMVVRSGLLATPFNWLVPGAFEFTMRDVFRSRSAPTRRDLT